MIKVLILTDHATHSAENSFYGLANALLRHSEVEELWVGSRSFSGNRPFFTGRKKSVYASLVSAPLSFDQKDAIFSLDQVELNLGDFPLIVLRLPRPFDKWLADKFKKVAPKSIFVNDPVGMVQTGTKAYLLRFANLCPPIRMCYTLEDITAMKDQMDIVLKPVEAYGGYGLLRIIGDTVDDGDRTYTWEAFKPMVTKRLQYSAYLGMKYLPNVDQGDKRIIVVGGKIISASLRLPAKDSWLCNVSRGGHAVPTEISQEEVAMVEQVSPDLLEEGILIYGMDTLVDDQGKRVLSELNTLSIGGLVQSEQQTQTPILDHIASAIIKQYHDRLS